MLVKKIDVKNLRVHKNFSLSLSDDTTLITGLNGAGKTTIIEALYITFRGGSFKTDDQSLLKNGEDWWRIDVEFGGDNFRTVKYEPNKQLSKKSFQINNKQSKRLSKSDKLPVVLFEPNDLRLLHGSPSRRRHFIDHFISQVDTNYETVLRKYERALKQRNSLLKQSDTTQDDMFIWDVALSEYGVKIIEERIRFIEKINLQLESVYRQIAKINDIISVHYSDTLIDNASQKFMNKLQESFKKDKIVGFTTIGPHRDDVIFEFNKKPALSVASRGEVRSVMLALKSIETVLIEKEIAEKPLVLLDDVFSELDDNRQELLIDVMGNQQTVITSTGSIDSKYKIKTVNI